MNQRIRELVKQSGGEFWQRIESDGVLNKEAYITFDPQSLEKFAELLVRECAKTAEQHIDERCDRDYGVGVRLKQHFGVEE